MRASDERTQCSYAWHRKYKDWEIRRYKPFLTAEIALGEGGLEAADQALRRYLAGSNDRKQVIDRTTPLFRDSAGKGSYMLPGNKVRHTSLHRGLFR